MPHTRVRREQQPHHANQPGVRHSLARREEEVHRTIQTRLRVSSLNRDGINARRAAAVGALNEAYDVCGEPPSLNRYEALRKTHPEYGWLPATTLKRYLAAGTWSDALSEAGIDAPTFFDEGSPELGPSFTADEALAALRECVHDLGREPSVNEYVTWAHRHDVLLRTGRRPKTHAPFTRMFGNWIEALRAATGIDAEGGIAASGRVRYAGFRIRDEAIAAGLQVVARRVRHSPTTADYTHHRELLWGTERHAIPSVATILRRFGTWDNALVFAELPPRMGRPTTGRRSGPKEPWMTTTIALKAMVRALREVGDRLSPRKYITWRQNVLQDDYSQARALPSLSTILLRFGSWSQALSAARGALDGEPTA